MTFPPPRITIANAVSISAQDFRWSLTPGVEPYLCNIHVPAQVSGQLEALPNPTYLQVLAFGGTKGEPEQKIIDIQNVNLLEPKKVSPFHVQWTIADSRWQWRGIKLFCSYNKTRVANYRTLASGPQGNEETTPARLRTSFDTFANGRYLPWSLKDQEVPWTVMGVIENLFALYSIPFIPQAGSDGDYVIENIELNGVPFYQGITQLLRMARLNMSILLTGEVYLYSLDFYDDTQLDLVYQYQNQAKLGPGVIYKTNKAKVRPKSIKVHFEKKMEVRLVQGTTEGLDGPVQMTPTSHGNLWGFNEADKWRTVCCQNVVCVPYPVKRKNYNYDYQIGEYVPLWEYIASLNPPLTEENIRNNWFGEALERYYTYQLSGSLVNTQNEHIISMIVSALRSSYRQLYQIDPYFMNMIRFWEPRRSGIIDAFSGYSPPSPVFGDYCLLMNRRHPLIAKRIDTWRTRAYNWVQDIYDWDRVHPTLGSISVVDQALGIFRVTYPPLIDGHVRSVIPSAVDPLPEAGLDGVRLEQSHLAASHTFDTIISVVWDVYDRNALLSGAQGFGHPKKFYSIPFDFTARGGEGPEMEVFCSLDYARLRCKELETLVGATGAVGGAILGKYTNDEEPVNLGIVETLARTEVAKVMNSFRDRYQGIVKLAGFVPINITGNMLGVTHSFSNRGMTTEVDLRGTPPVPTTEQLVPARVLAYLRKQVTRASERWIAK